MYARNKEEVEYYNKYFGQLKGATIEKAEMVEDPDERGAFWPTLQITLASGEVCTCELSQDPEGNGSGFMFGLPDPR